jgi:6-phosphogluconate dehydrogenase
MTNKNTIGIIGLGKMGGNLALQAVDKGYTVIGYSRHFKEHLQRNDLVQANTLDDMVNRLSLPRIIFVFVPAGPTVDKILDQLAPLLAPGDIVADCGNSYWGDSKKRYERLSRTGLHFIDCGTSGGLEGARHGACFMVGGDHQPVQLIEPVLKRLAVDGGYVHAGKPGAGHFSKLVHNGIEFGMLQSIGEGVALLSTYQEELNVHSILQCWENGSVIRSWLIELMRKQHEEQKGLHDVPAYVEDTGEVNWLVNDAMHMEVPIPVIAQSVMQLMASRNKEGISAKAIALMRHAFGGHPLGEDESIKRERKVGQLK